MRCPTLSDLPPPTSHKTGWPWTEESPRLPDVMPDGSPWPCVSIVTPSYNQGQYLEETIRSVLLQGYPNLEYMIIDGGSTDSSVDIIREYEPWLAYWVSEPDRGQSHAINKGLRRAQGEAISYLNSDDTLQPGVLHRVIDTFLAHPETAMVYGDCNLVDGEGRRIQKLKSRTYQRADLLLANYIQQSSAFVRRNVFECVGLLDESFHMCMDYDYWVRLAMAGFNMIYLPEILSSARLTPGTKTKNLSLRFLPDILRVLDSVYNRSDVPDDVHRAKRKAYANVWRLGGVRYFDAGMRRLAITAMFKSLSWNPLPGWRPLVVTLLIILQSALGVHWRSAYTVEKAASAFMASESISTRGNHEHRLNWLVRYQSVTTYLQTLPASQSTLEVGSGAIGLSCLHPYPFVGCDLNFETSPHFVMRPVIASALALPFTREAFSTIVCMDVLEHIAPDERPTLLKELLRVARSRVILAFPNGPAARRADTWLANYYRLRRVPLPPWLQEHLQWPLPSAQEVETQFATWPLLYTRQDNAAWPLHLLLVFLDTTRVGPWLARLAERYPRYVLGLLHWLDRSRILGNVPRPYRIVYWVDKKDTH